MVSIKIASTMYSARRQFFSRLIPLRTPTPFFPTSPLYAGLAAAAVAPEAAIRHQVNGGAEDSFYVVSKQKVLQKAQQWAAALPRVAPYYAVKCNPDPQIIELLADLGVHFDCASRQEIEMVTGLGIASQRIIYANPCKQPAHLRFARSVGVSMSVVDSEDEVHKMVSLHPECDALVRIAVDDSDSICELSCKYGADPDSTNIRRLLATAQSNNLNVRGVSFHVGSGCYNPDAFRKAISSAREVFDVASTLGLHMDTLDIGGGFPGLDTPQLHFNTIAARINDALNDHFPCSSEVRVIAEPGRFFVASSHTLAVNIIGRKLKISGDGTPHWMYFVNDGLYGSFNCMLYDHQQVQWTVLQSDAQVRDATLHQSSIWGPTCDGLDCITKDAMLPELQMGQWMYFQNMGAYTSAAGSNFNGMDLPNKIYQEVSSMDSAMDLISGCNASHAPLCAAARVSEL